MTRNQHPATSGHRTVTLYTRRNCALCDDALAELRKLARELDFTIIELNVDTDIELFEKYTDLVPVIAIGHRVIAHAPLAYGELPGAISAALRA